jgi:hypothetical protein
MHDNQSASKRMAEAVATPNFFRLPPSMKLRCCNALPADVFALYIKTKTFHWHMSGPHFRDYHLLLDEKGDQISQPLIRSRNVSGRSAAPRYGPSAKSGGCGASWTMTRIT